MNGYEIIASVIVDHRSQVIIGETWKNGAMAYVVATADHPDDNPTEWRSGRYFDGGRDSKRRAREHFLAILHNYWNE